MYRTLALHLVLALVGCGGNDVDPLHTDTMDTFVDPPDSPTETHTGDSDTGPTGETETDDTQDTEDTQKGDTFDTTDTAVVPTDSDTGVVVVIPTDTGCDSGDTAPECVVHTDTDTDTDVVPTDSDTDTDTDVLPTDSDTDIVITPTGGECDSGDTACDTDTGLECDSGDTAAACQPDPCELTFEITTAIYATEDSIDILDSDGNIVAEWPPSGTTLTNNTSYTWTVSVDPDDIVIALKDSFGDGWHSGHSLTVTTNSGEVVADVTDFLSGSLYEIDYRHDCDGTVTAPDCDTAGTDTGLCWEVVPACTMEFDWSAQSSWVSGDATFTVYDEDGNEIFNQDFDNATSWTHEEVMSSGNYYAVMTYDYQYAPLTNSFSVTELSTAETEAELTMDLGGYDWEWFSIDCEEDTAWAGQDSGWGEPAAGELPPTTAPMYGDTSDTADDGTCFFTIQMVSPRQATYPYDYSLADDIGWTLFDDEKNVIESVAAGDLYINYHYTYEHRLDAGRYMLHMTDDSSDGWEGGWFRVFDADGELVENITLESGDEGYEYIDLECEGDTFEHWDSAPNLEDDTAWWAPDPYFGCPLMLAINTDGRAYEMDFNITDAVTGEVVYSSYDAFVGGVVESSEVQYASLALPDGSYNLNLIEDNTYTSGWNYYSWVRAYDTEGDFVAGGGLFGTSGTAVYPFDWDCAEDTAAWWPDEIDAMRDDSGWEMGQGWADTDIAETCGFMVEVLSPYNATGGAWEIYDLEGHLLYSTTPGDMTNGYATYHTSVELPTGGYRFRMIDTNNGGFYYYLHPENFRLYDSSGNMVDSFGMGGYGIGSAQEWFIVDCQDDTDTDLYTWDSDWCEPVLDTSMGTADGACASVIHIKAGAYDYYDIGVTIEDSDGNVVFQIEPGDLTEAGDYYYPFDYPSDGYQVILEDGGGTYWSTGSIVEILQGDGCVDDMDIVSGPWTLDYYNSENVGGYWNDYYVHTCEADTAAEFTWDSGWCEPILDSGEISTGACGYVLAVRAGWDYAYMQITIEDSDGNQVYQIAAGDLPAEDMYYFPVNLPSDGYTITWSDEYQYSEYWDTDAWFQLIPVDDGSACVDLEYDGTDRYTLPSGYGGERTEYVALNCAEDTAGDFEWDTDWCEPVLDSGETVSGECGYVLEVRADFDYYDMVIELTDSDGNVLIDIQENDLTSSGFYYYPVNLPSDGYHLHMEDAYDWGVSSWGTNAYVRLIPASGDCIFEEDALESFRVDADDFGVADEYFIMNCDEDTGDSFSWDSGWCEPIIDTADMPTGDCGYVLEVAADWDYSYMEVNITDADGTEIIDIAAGDITAEGQTYYPVNLGTNGYTMTLGDSSGSGYWGTDAYVRLIPVDGSCVDAADIEAAEQYRVDTNGEEIINFEVDCADDTASFGWDSGWCEVILDDTAGTGGLTGCEQLIDISTFYGYQMGVEITDASGTVIFDIDYGDLGYYSQYFYTVNMPTGGYQVTLYDDGGNGWQDSTYYAPGSIAIYEGNGVCMGEEAIFGPYTLPDLNGPTTYTDIEQSFNIWVDCAADTSTDTEDTSWFGDSTWAP